MENNTENSQAHECVELPTLIKAISINEVDGFDTFEVNKFESILVGGIEKADVRSVSDLQPISTKKIHAVSISMPPSPVHKSPKKVNFGEATTSIGKSETGGREGNKTRFYSQPMPNGAVPGGVIKNNENQNPASDSTEKFYSQPMPRGLGNAEIYNGGVASNPRISRLKDKRYDSFKTFSGKLERQISNLRGRAAHESVPEENDSQDLENYVTMPVSRYYDALEGPELETLRDSEEIVLPEDRLWPFLLRFPISSFGICLGVSSQAIMWKTLASSTSTKFLRVSPMVNMVLWFISVALMIIVASTYILKVIFYFEAVRREYYHPIRVNFFFAPWIALLFLVQGIPTSFAEKPPHALWYVLMAPIFCLELKIYGQWMSGGQRRLSKVANPSNHLSIVGNFVGALLGATMGLKEGPIFFFAVGLAHYIVLFVTLYQRLPTNETLPKELHPVFFLFVAAPNVASIAWSTIQGSFDYGSRIAYFIGLFLYFSLAVRVNFFRGFRFSLSWWAYTFPMTGAAIATMKYSNEVTNVVTQALSVILCSVSTLTVTALLVSTILHAFVLVDLFPNDIGIAISDRKPMQQNKWFHLRRGSSEATDIENYLKFVTSSDKDIEAALKPAAASPGVKETQSSKS